MVSGSGSANVAIVGQFTIPLMKRHGIPSKFAAAVEAASGLGGLIMPPVMAVAAFLMANYLGVSYWDVVARGFAPAITYYAVLAFTVYLLTLRFVRRSESKEKSIIQLKPGISDIINTLIFFISIAILCYLMGVLWMAPEDSAFIVMIVFLVLSLIAQIIFTKPKSSTIIDWFRNSIESFGSMTADIVLLLASLNILVNLFTISGWLLKLNMMLMTVAGGSLIYLLVIAYIAGMFLGLGLPPSATYLLTVIVIAPAMARFGINPWVIQFFAFFMGIISEYTPPTSITVAVTSKIAESEFIKTMFETVRICLPVFLFPFLIFRYPSLVIEPGLAQLYPMGVIWVGASGIACAFYARYSRNKIIDLALRILVMITSLITLFHPDPIYALVALLVTISIIVLGVYRMRKIA
jgi:TRAP transporter 4TM/12TM fusion protein